MSLTLLNQDRGQAKCSGCYLQCYTAQKTWWHCLHGEFPEDDNADNRFVCPSDSASSIVATSNSSVAVRSEAGIAAGTDRKHNVWAKVHVAKAIEENANNVAKKMAEFNAIENKLTLLERMRGEMGEADYTARVKELLDTMPDTKLFAKQCEVICIDKESTSNAAAADNDEASSKKKRSCLH